MNAEHLGNQRKDRNVSESRVIARTETKGSKHSKKTTSEEGSIGSVDITKPPSEANDSTELRETTASEVAPMSSDSQREASSTSDVSVATERDVTTAAAAEDGPTRVDAPEEERVDESTEALTVT